MTATSPRTADRPATVLPGMFRSLTVVLVLALAACGTTGSAGSRSSSTTSSGTTSSATTSSATSQTDAASGEAVPTAAALLGQARRQAAAATTAHVSGSWGSGDAASAVDLAGRLDGTNSRLRVTMAGQEATVLTVDGTSYLLGTRQTWSRASDSSAASLLALALPRLDRGKARAMAGLTVGGVVRDVLDDPGVAALSDAVVSRTTVDGRAAYLLARGGEQARVVVSADGSARLLQATGLRGPLLEVAVDEWDAVAPFRAPRPTKVVDPPRS